MLIDTHCHINMIVKKEFDRLLTQEECQNAQIIINNAQKAGVEKIINIGTSVIESKNCITLAQLYKPVYASVGIHPNDATKEWKKDFAIIAQLVEEKEKNKIVAIGECGIDMHYQGYDLQRQQDVFRAHIELALEHNLALVIHSRDAQDETIAVLDEYKHESLRGSMHCFAGTIEFARESIRLGFFLGIGGTITYPKNQELRDIVLSVGDTNILLETDAPFLPPQELRGTRNEPSNIALIADYISSLLAIDKTVLGKQTTSNACTLFGL